MEKDFKHPQISSDLLMFYKRYYPIHAGLPKPFRFTTGESILTEITQCLKLFTLADQCNKNDAIARAKGAESLGQLRVSIEVIRSYLLVAWQLKLLSHGGLHELTGVLESVSKHATRWQQWFDGRNAEVLS
jgi:hypothetical protein